MYNVALIPCYCPDSKLSALVEELSASRFHIVLVDDGSGPAYQPIFQRAAARATVLSYPENHGKGYALKFGLQYILEHDLNGIVVTLDCDGQHRVSDAITLCHAVAENPALFAIGSRRLSEEDPWKSRLGHFLTRNLYRLTTGISIHDTQSGLRAFSSAQIPLLLTVDGARYEYEMNVLLRLAKAHVPMAEYPMETIYFDKQNSISHYSPITDSARIFFEILKYVTVSLISFLLDYGVYSLLLFSASGLLYGVVLANYGARAVSSIFNFILNRRLVFRSKGKPAAEAAKYFALVLCSITVSSALLTALTGIGWNPYVAKPIVEIMLFVVNYLVQHHFIFKGPITVRKEKHA